MRPLGLLLNILVPSCCAGCGSPRYGTGGGGACAACWRSLQGLDPEAVCPGCGLPAQGTCASCSRETFPTSRVLSFGLYEGTLARLVVAFKFKGFDLLGEPFAQKLAEVAARAGLLTDTTALVPVPSTRRRNRERGYDPAELLALGLARHMRRPVLYALDRIRDTPPQSALPACRRTANVAGAFRAERRSAGESLLLVDDVLTTGATARSAAQALLDAGARQVSVLTLARTPEPGAFRQPELS